MFNNRFNIKSIVNRITNNSEDGSSGDGGDAVPSTVDDQHSAEGFLCPLCMTAFSSGGELKAHYESMHPEQFSASSQVADNDTFAMKELLQELEDAQQLLENERKTSMEYQAEFEKLQNNLIAKEEESVKLRSSEKELLKSNGLLISEVTLLRQQLGEKTEQVSSLRKEKEQIIVNLAGQIDKVKQENASLNAQLAHRNSVDDTEVLKLELVNIQKTMDQLRSEKETENESLKKEIVDLNSVIQEKERASRAAQIEYLEKIKAASAVVLPEVAEDSSVEQYKTSVQQLKLEVEKLRAQLNEYEEILATMNGQKDELETANIQIAELNKNIHNLKLALSQVTSERDNLQIEFHNEKENISTKEQLLQEKERELGTANSKFESLKDNFNELNNIRITLEQERAEFKQLLNSATEDLEQKRTEISTLTSELHLEKRMHNETSEEYKKQFNSLEKEKELLITKNEEMSKELNHAVHELETASKLNKKTIAECDARVLDVGTQLKIVEENYKAANTKCDELQNSAEAIKSQLQNEISSLTAKEEQYKRQIGEYETNIKELNVNIEKTASELEMLRQENKNIHLEKSDLEKLIKSTNSMNESLKSELNEIQTSVEKTKNRMDELTARNKQNEDLVKEKEQLLEKLEAELSESNKTRGILQTKNDELTAEKLDFEKSFKSIEQRNALLMERCLSSDNEKEKLHEAMSDLRRKLEDSAAALQDLGRENQALQVECHKMTAGNRQWADDSLVTNCTTCTKDFTLTNRKHHCRHCGQIFCKDCSSRTAKIPSSKNPVRVCDACYDELVPK